MTISNSHEDFQFLMFTMELQQIFSKYEYFDIILQKQPCGLQHTYSICFNSIFLVYLSTNARMIMTSF